MTFIGTPKGTLSDVLRRLPTQRAYQIREIHVCLLSGAKFVGRRDRRGR